MARYPNWQWKRTQNAFNLSSNLRRATNITSRDVVGDYYNKRDAYLSYLAAGKALLRYGMKAFNI